ncbi:MAG: flagellar type III secretion system protein FliR [Candidatus Omnitrophica bacterium]|nr:flagellar type III secretion system protein FliR [Candidatus Omnitrophota bacterium]
MEMLNSLLQFNTPQFQSFILLVARFSGLFLTAPVFSNPVIPKMVKLGLMFFLGFIIFPFVEKIPLVYENPFTLFVALVKEFGIGVFLGFFVSLIFIGLQLAGQFIDYQTGFGLVNVIDPESQVQVPLAGRFLYILAALLFLIIGGHHLIIKSLAESFRVFPLGNFTFDLRLLAVINRTFVQLFFIAFKIAAPVVAAVFLAEMSYGVVARAIPQLNILIVGLPLKLGLGTYFLLLTLPFFFWIVKREFFNIFLSIRNLFQLLR